MKTIPGYENFSITRDGKIWSKKTKTYLKFRFSNGGYPRIILRSNGEIKTFSISRLMCITYKILKKCKICQDTKNLVVHHKNEIKTDNSLANLECLCNSCHNSHHKKGKSMACNGWNKGLKMPESVRKKISIATRGKNNPFYGRSWDEFPGGHPRGMLGKKHSEEVKKRISIASKLMWQKRRPQ